MAGSVTYKWKFTISYKKNRGRHYRLSCARESTVFWRKSCGTYIVILLPEFLPTVQSEEVLQTCCVRIWVWLFFEFTSLNSLSNISRLKSRISKIQVARPRIELQTPCSASHDLKHSTTTTPFSTIALDKRYVHDTMKHTMRQKEKEQDLTQ